MNGFGVATRLLLGVLIEGFRKDDGRIRLEDHGEGRVLLQSIRAKIDYFSYTVQTIYGVLDIKIELEK